MKISTPILVWRFEDAPETLRKLSTHGGDEDWLILFPPGYDPAETTWGDPEHCVLGDWCNSRHTLPGGGTVVIAAHS